MRLADDLVIRVLERLQWSGASVVAWACCRRFRRLTDGGEAERPPGRAWRSVLLPSHRVAPGWSAVGEAPSAELSRALRRLSRAYLRATTPGELVVLGVPADLATSLARGLPMTGLDLSQVHHVWGLDDIGAMSGLASLELSSRLGDTVDELSRTLGGLRLTTLGLRGTAVCQANGDARRLARALAGLRLTDLDLSYNAVGHDPEGVAAMAETLAPMPLRRLDFGANYVAGTLGAGRALARALAGLDSLRSLALDRNYLGESPDDALALVRAIINLDLVELGLEDNCLGNPDRDLQPEGFGGPPPALEIIGLLGGGHIAGTLRRLNLAENGLGEVLDRPGPTLPRELLDLDLAHNRLSAAQLTWLEPPALLQCRLANNRLGLDPGSMPRLPSVKTVDLTNNGFDSAGLASLLATMPRATDVELGRNPLNTLRPLLPRLRRLRRLSIRSTHQAFRPVADLGRLDRLVCLCLDSNMLGGSAEDWARLAGDLGQMTSLEELHLSRNAIGAHPGGTAQLAGAVARLARLRVLAVRENKLARRAGELTALVRCLPAELTTLDLSSNSIGLYPDELGCLLDLVTSRPHRLTLTLDHNCIGRPFDDVARLCRLSWHRNPGCG